MTSMTIDVSADPLLAARNTLAAALEAATGYDVYVGAQSNVATPCVVIEPNGWSAAQAAVNVVTYTVTITCLYNAAEGAIDGVEEMARKVYLALANAGWPAVTVPAPSGLTYNERTFIGVQFTAGTTTTL